MPKFQLLSKLFLAIVFVVFLLGLVPTSIFAATLSLTPSSQAVTLKSPFSVTINIDTLGESTTATDVVLTFDPSLLEIQAIDFTQPPLYPTNTKVLDNTTGKIRMTSTHEDAVNSYVGSGTLATFTFYPKAVGTAYVNFTCETGKTNDTNIFKKGTSTDIAVCANLIGGIYSIGTSGQVGTLPSATPRQSLPTSGNIGPTGIILIGGAILLGIGALVLIL